ncbi:protein phosphatase Slingshot homolog 1-like [Palaemon carinicauda]|uniref:protein phosphatase Slingshot homolog 1-like n=1 Tax=Palaemon carinicauda TaxID=392227 RepID=UPI0035B684FD
MTQVDIDEVTSKYIRQRLEEELAMDLFKFKSYIDQEMLVILGQMDAATEIFPHVYLGSEWNASNLEELQKNGVGYILNVTKEIDNFYPGTFDYLNIRVYDDEKTELLKHWDSTFKYIAQVKTRGSKVLVHCKMGISRSASVVIAYAMKAFNMSLEEALNLVKKKRTCIRPNQAFCNQLKTYEGILDASRQRHNILWRSKSETNLKSATAPANRSGLRSRPPPNGNDGVDSVNRENLHKSTEEIRKYDYQAFDTLSVRVPGSCDFQQGRRPKSWSPDDHTAGLLFPKDAAGEGTGDFGESWRLSQSLNVQSWRAHVTLQQRDLREFSMEGSTAQHSESSSPVAVVEALNPLYADIPPPGNTINEVSSLQLSSSVKERINEFESVQTCKSQNSKKGDVAIIQLQNTTSSSDDFGHLSSTAELDKVIETLLSPSAELLGSEPVISQTKPAAQKHQAVLIPSQIWLEERAAQVDESLEVGECPVVPKESVIVVTPTGIVKRQKQDLEEKVKMSDVKNAKDGDSPLSRQSSSGSLSGQFPKVEVR